jgi:hypothetical protein
MSTRPESLNDVLALLDAVANGSNAVPFSKIERRAQSVVNRFKTRSGCEAARTLLGQRKVATKLPPQWLKLDIARARFETVDIPNVQNTIRAAGTVLPFLPDLIPARLVESVTAWSRGEGGASPKSLLARVATAAKRAKKMQPVPLDPFQARRFLGTRSGHIVGSHTPPRAYARR